MLFRSFRVFVDRFYASCEVAGITLHEQSIPAIVHVLISGRKVVLQGTVVSSLRVDNKTAQSFGKSDPRE